MFTPNPYGFIPPSSSSRPFQPTGGTESTGYSSVAAGPFGSSSSIYDKNRAILEKESQVYEYSTFQIKKQLDNFTKKYNQQSSRGKSAMRKLMNDIRVADRAAEVLLGVVGLVVGLTLPLRKM